MKQFVCCIGAWTSPSIGAEIGYTEDAKFWQPYFQFHFVTWTFTVGWIEVYDTEDYEIYIEPQDGP